MTLFLGIVYLIFDRQLYYYGKNDLSFYNLLPLNIVPEDRPKFENGFALKDEYGITIAAKGNSYMFNDTRIKVDKVLGYCFDNNKVIAKISDANQNKYYIEFTNNIEKKTNQDIIATVMIDSKVLSQSDYKCINIEDNKTEIDKLVLPRNYLLLVFIIMLIISLGKTIKSTINK